MFKALNEWIETRIGLEQLLRDQIIEYRVPGDINVFYTLGFVAAGAFAIQVLTGIVLLTSYVPHPDYAFKSVQNIMMVVPFGWLFRTMHVVGSNLMVITVMAHMLSVLFMKSYAKPREMTWIAGALMLFLVLTFCLSGYLLPWSQLSYWATTIVTSIPTAFPVVGVYAADFLRGGQQVSGATLGRFFALHVGLLPALLAIVITGHIFLVRRIGISGPPFSKGFEDPEWTAFHHEEHEDGIPFSAYMVKELFMMAVYMGLMFFIIAFIPTLFFPETANIPADPLKTPAHIKPEWYFLAPYQMLKLVPSKLLGILLQTCLAVVFLAWPFIDRSRERNILKRPLFLAVILAALAIWVVLTIWGHYS